MMWPGFFSAAFPNEKTRIETNSSYKPERVVMPNGVDGYLCLKCKVFCAYVEANSDKGYICPDCR